MISNISSSYKDPDARVVFFNGQIFRLIFNTYQSNYNLLHGSGLLQDLIEQKLLIPHQEVSENEIKLDDFDRSELFRIIKPEKLNFISYPYEWSFSHFKRAALLTLRIQLNALEKGMSLKDATAFNVQFKGVKPIFIDTTSFEAYKDNEPWVAYGQFCRHFLGPLLLFKYNRPEVVKLSQLYMDGIPLKVISEALPFKTRFNFSVATHIHYHSKLETSYSKNDSFRNKKISLPRSRLLAFLKHLEGNIKNLELNERGTQWNDYYQTCSYSEQMINEKRSFIKSILEELKPSSLLDLGCNDGAFSELAGIHAQEVISADIDHAVIDRFFRKLENEKKQTIHPMILDVNNPSPAIGWMNVERTSFINRKSYDVVMALALIHHLAIANNLPLSAIAKFFSELGNSLLIEFVPKDDAQTQKLLVTKKDVFSEYNELNFKKAFLKYFVIQKEFKISNSNRVLYYMKKNA